MEQERKGIVAWLRGRIHAISVVIGNLAARIILGKKGFNEAYRMNLKNSIAEDLKGKADAYKDRKMNEPAEEQKTEKQVNPMEQKDTADTGTIFVRTVPKDNQDINLNEKRYINCGFIPATKETMYIDTESITPHMTSIDLRVPKENMGIFIGKKGANIKKAEAALKQAFPNLEKINAKEYIPERENSAPEPDAATAKNISVKNNNGVINTGSFVNITQSVKGKPEADAGHDDYDEPQTMEAVEKAGVVSPHAKKLYQLAKEHSSEIIKIMDKAAPELKENQDLRVELEDLDLIISKASESGELRAVIQEKGQDGEIIMSLQDLEGGNYLQYLQEAFLAAGDIEQHAQDEEIIKEEEDREEQARQDEESDIFAGFLDEDIPEEPYPMKEGTFSVLDMNIQDAQESEQEIGHDVADAGCQDFGDRM